MDVSNTSYLLSLDASTGIQNWRYRVDNSIGSPAVEYEGRIYLWYKSKLIRIQALLHQPENR